MNQTIHYSITYIDVRTGLKADYMNIGFASEHLAQLEINRLLRAKKKYKLDGVKYNPDYPSFCPVALIGCSYKIKSIKLKSCATLPN